LVGNRRKTMPALLKDLERRRNRAYFFWEKRKTDSGKPNQIQTRRGLLPATYGEGMRWAKTTNKRRRGVEGKAQIV